MACVPGSYVPAFACRRFAAGVLAGQTSGSASFILPAFRLVVGDSRLQSPSLTCGVCLRVACPRFPVPYFGRTRPGGRADSVLIAPGDRSSDWSRGWARWIWRWRPRKRVWAPGQGWNPRRRLKISVAVRWKSMRPSSLVRMGARVALELSCGLGTIWLRSSARSVSTIRSAPVVASFGLKVSASSSPLIGSFPLHENVAGVEAGVDAHGGYAG